MSKNILFISPQPEWGGAATANISIARLLQESGYEVIYNDEYFNGDKFNEVCIHHFSIHKDVSRPNANLIRLVKEKSIDTIIWGNTWMFYRYLPSIIWFSINEIKQLSIYHSLKLGSSTSAILFERICSFTTYFMDHIVCVSQYTIDCWNKYIGFRINKKKCISIFNPMPLAGTKHKMNPKPIIGFVGRFSEEKQPQLFCKLSESSDYGFVTFGDGPLLDTMMRSYPKVEYKGHCMDMEEIYSTIDILVMTSKFENCPMVILEAKSHGIPCIAPKVGGIPEIVVDGEDGFLYDQFTTDGVITMINHIRNYYDSFSESCRRHALNFEPSVIAEKWCNLLNS